MVLNGFRELNTNFTKLNSDLNKALPLSSEYAKHEQLVVYSDVVEAMNSSNANQLALDYAKLMFSILEKTNTAGCKCTRSYSISQLSKDGTKSLGSGRGWFDFYSNNTYATTISDISKARMTCILCGYGVFPMYINIWGNRVKMAQIVDGVLIYGTASYTTNDIV